MDIHGGLMVTNGGFLVVLWWFYGGFMVIYLWETNITMEHHQSLVDKSTISMAIFNGKL